MRALSLLALTGCAVAGPPQSDGFARPGGPAVDVLVDDFLAEASDAAALTWPLLD